MITIMQVSIIIDTILPFLAILQSLKSILLLRVIYDNISFKRINTEDEPLVFLLSNKKKLTAIIIGLIISLFAIANLILLTWSISRIENAWAGYSTRWIEFTAVFFHLIMYSISCLLVAVFNRNSFEFINRIRSKFLINHK